MPELNSFSKTVQQLWDIMNPCTLCPRMCKVYRSKGQTGFCGIGDLPVVSSVGPHFGEESVLVGAGGSGTIFFAGCNLGCIFCQNYDISHLRHGRKATIQQLAQYMLDLQNYGCSNINFVTPTHIIPAIIAAIELAKENGLVLPMVYNTGGYDSVDTLRLIDGYIDIYMPDMKYSDTKIAKALSAAPDYPQINFSAVKEMHRQVGDLKVQNGLAIRGLLVRHLVLPNNLAGSFKIIDFLSDATEGGFDHVQPAEGRFDSVQPREAGFDPVQAFGLVALVSSKTTINVMDQYRPCYKAASYPKINRRPTMQEIESVRQYAIQKGLNVLI